MLHVAFAELVCGRAENLVSENARLGMDQSHRILKLIAETEGAPGLIKPAPRPQPTREHLVKQPAIGEEIERSIRRLHIHRAERAIPISPHAFQRAAGGPISPKSLDQMASVAEVSSRAECKRDLPFFTVGQLDHHLHCGTRIKSAADAP
jgi:hypothetical protein